MKECFADTFVFLALLNPNDRAHSAAVKAMNELRDPLVTTAWVLTELADGLCARDTRETFVNLEKRIRTNKRIVVVPPGQSIFDRGMDLYRSRKDKDWSLSDCTSFVVMEERGITDALTGDHHFEQAGFRILL
jgi:predicted nucleic acid-binding protein